MKKLAPPEIAILICVMHKFLALLAVGLEAAASITKSKIEKTAAAIVVGIGLLFAPVEVQSDDT